MKEHELKTWPAPFEAMVDCKKRHEVRVDDGRGFAVGDRLRLREWLPKEKRYTGRWMFADVTYISRAPEWGLPVTPEGPLVVMTVSVWQLRFGDDPVGPPR